MQPQYSVLMPLWYLEKNEYIYQSLKSVLQQTVSPTEIVLVVDHPLLPETEELLAQLQKQHPDTQIRKMENFDLLGKGLGAVLAFGVLQCQYEFVARMDTDDICFLDRCEKELDILMKFPSVAIVGGGLEKFTVVPEQVDGYRLPPEKGRNLIQYSKYRNPFNHPTVMFRRDVILQVGNYSPLKECEDYELWYRVLKNGYEGYNLQHPVLHYRAGTDMLKRRKNKRFFRQSVDLVLEMKRDRYINWLEMIAALGMQAVRFYAPFGLNKIVYKYVRS
ncbi:glycosyltransferase [Clostridiaceae bacterium]|nr:glycosyltransferase [Lachnospiraceae bacterium]NBH19986.1 glycosyltransferase [Clostridiaceae bacterium]